MSTCGTQDGDSVDEVTVVAAQADGIALALTDSGYVTHRPVGADAQVRERFAVRAYHGARR